jgi:serine/threonine protein kinase
VVHRDVKPPNLFLVGASVDALRVIDFGIARGDTLGSRLTATGLFVGTPAYMAPEQFRGEHGVGADVWGLGVTLFEALTGRVPFRGNDPATVLSAVMSQPTPSLVAQRPDAPRALDLLLGRMLSKSASDRPGSMDAVGTELADLRAALVHFDPPPAGLSIHEQAAPLGSDPDPHETLEAPSGRALVGRGRVFGAVAGLL